MQLHKELGALTDKVEAAYEALKTAAAATTRAAVALLEASEDNELSAAA